MWINFAKTGNPSIESGQIDGVGAIPGDVYAPQNYPVMILNANGCAQTNDPVKEQTDLIQDLFWLKIKE